ncbi:NAD(P)-dependent oxidoreductase [Halalkalibacter flavus]|uniref:NAD(P)-dependent oxidoreductase n=1 Tax=Halalkalibacter flavus TaxID=3090668 RepID=UPI002FCB86ED
MNAKSSTNISLVDLKKNFEEVHPGLSNQEAIEEANRCLYCYDAPCITACPTGIDIPTFIKKIASENLKGSAKTIMTSNPIGASCARVCPTEELCEGACVLNHSTKPIMIGNLQRFATDWAIKNEQVLFKAGQKNGKKVAIVGGGPAGLSAARELALLGYQVTIFEAEKEAGGLNTYGIVSFRLPQVISFWEVDQVKSLDVEIRTNTRVGKDVSVNELTENYDAVILAIGMSSVPQLGIDGEDLDGVYDAIDFVKETKEKVSDHLLGKRVVVIGAGNTAIDGATCSVRLGAENVKILYRRTEAEMTAYDFEYEFAKQDGVEFRWLTAPKRIIGDENGKVTAIECIKMKLGEPDEGGRRRPVPVEGSEFFTLQVDAVIKAIGQSRYIQLIEQFGLEHDGGVVKINGETFQTSNEKIFACGDVIFGKGQGEAMVVSATQQGKETAYAIHKQLFKQVTETA